ncbi:hypothetical protein Tsubulata_028704 [Turnera subulata]|uniref:Major facilitator superfamily (MFS) profile domain-containing protein n=1 Tax=Turnera subulata TaxID=218843 RepID=A0A9Q0FX66_9ROSI|nr:hypothetical protein Tsubulata_028704 [Turnera subulata]
MEPEHLEAGLPTKPLLVKSNSDVSSSSTTDVAISSDSSVTACVVFSTLIAVCGSFCYGCAMGYSSPAESGIMKDLGLSAAEYSVFGSVLTIGGVIGASLSGKIVGDKGPRGTMWISEVFSVIGWLAIVFAKGAWCLYAGRLSLGFGIGLITYVVPLYIAEIAPTNFRGTFASTNQLTCACALSIVYIAGNMIPWRLLAFVGALPFLVQFIGLFFVPESPRWLESMQALKQQPPQKCSDLFQRKYLQALIIPTTVMSLYLLDFCGRRPLLMISASGMCLCSFLVGLSFFLQNLQYLPNVTPVLAFIGILVYPALFSFGLGGIPWIIMSEIFPVKVKAAAGSLVALVSWSGSWIVTYTFNFMAEWSYPGTFFIFSAICASAVLFIWKLVPETKGRTLEEIQESFEPESCK